jgi:hypothetical protein
MRTLSSAAVVRPGIVIAIVFRCAAYSALTNADPVVTAQGHDSAPGQQKRLEPGDTEVVTSPDPVVTTSPDPATSPYPASTANLLFKSGFENGVSLSAPTDCGPISCYQYLGGSDVAGYSWPIDVWNASHSGIHMIAGVSTTPSQITGYVRNEIQTVTGHTGASTRALFQSIVQMGQSTQNYYRINLNGNEPSDHLYIRYWMKQQVDLYITMGIHAWRSFFWIKTKCDYRIESYIYTNSSGQEFWFTHGDNNYCGAYQQFWYDQDTTVPVPQGAWFPVEIYWKRSSGADGRFWTAINGRVVFDRQGSMRLSDPLLFIAPFGVYTAGGFPAYQWVDDIEIWDDFPCDAPPCGGPV